MPANFAKRKAKGKRDRLTMSFGEHSSTAGNRRFLDLVSRHRGLVVVEHASGTTPKESREAMNVREGYGRGEWKKIIAGLDDRLKKAEAEAFSRLYLERRGRVTWAEVYSARELARINRLNSLIEKHMSEYLKDFTEGRLDSGLVHFNGMLDTVAELERFRDTRIVKNVSRMKGGVLARYGTVHSLVSREIRRARPEARMEFEERPIFSHFDALVRLKTMGKAQSPPREELVKCYLGVHIAGKRQKTAESLGISKGDPGLNLFFKALLDLIPAGEREAMFRKACGKNPADKAKLIWGDVCLQNNVPAGFPSLKPKDQLKIMRQTCAKAYGENSKLYRVAYPERR